MAWLTCCFRAPVDDESKELSPRPSGHKTAAPAGPVRPTSVASLATSKILLDGFQLDAEQGAAAKNGSFGSRPASRQGKLPGGVGGWMPDDARQYVSGRSTAVPAYADSKVASTDGATARDGKSACVAPPPLPACLSLSQSSPHRSQRATRVSSFSRSNKVLPHEGLYGEGMESPDSPAGYEAGKLIKPGPQRVASVSGMTSGSMFKPTSSFPRRRQPGDPLSVALVVIRSGIENASSSSVPYSPAARKMSYSSMAATAGNSPPRWKSQSFTSPDSIRRRQRDAALRVIVHNQSIVRSRPVRQESGAGDCDNDSRTGASPAASRRRRAGSDAGRTGSSTGSSGGVLTPDAGCGGDRGDPDSEAGDVSDLGPRERDGSTATPWSAASVRQHPGRHMLSFNKERSGLPPPPPLSPLDDAVQDGAPAAGAFTRRRDHQVPGEGCRSSSEKVLSCEKVCAWRLSDCDDGDGDGGGSGGEHCATGPGGGYDGECGEGVVPPASCLRRRLSSPDAPSRSGSGGLMAGRCQPGPCEGTSGELASEGGKGGGGVGGPARIGSRSGGPGRGSGSSGGGSKSEVEAAGEAGSVSERWMQSRRLCPQRSILKKDTTTTDSGRRSCEFVSLAFGERAGPGAAPPLAAHSPTAATRVYDDQDTLLATGGSPRTGSLESPTSLPGALWMPDRGTIAGGPVAAVAGADGGEAAAFRGPGLGQRLESPVGAGAGIGSFRGGGGIGPPSSPSGLEPGDGRPKSPVPGATRWVSREDGSLRRLTGSETGSGGRRPSKMVSFNVNAGVIPDSQGQ